MNKKGKGKEEESASAPNLPLQHAWYEVRRDKKWQSLALVPATDDWRVFGTAVGFALLSSREPDQRVLVVDASLANCRPDAAGTDIERLWQVAPSKGTAKPFTTLQLSDLALPDAETALSGAPAQLPGLLGEVGYTTAIFAMDSPLSQTRSIGLLRAVDRVVICVPLGLAQFKETRQIIDIIGADTVMGAIAVNVGASSGKELDPRD